MISIVVPTLGRPSLADLLDALAGQLHRSGLDSRPAVEILLVDDRTNRGRALRVPTTLAPYAVVLSSRGAGPAAARNLGWRAARHRWIVFLDDDVVPTPDWWHRLLTDLDVPDWVGGVQGRVRVPLPVDRRPTDWERVTAGLTEGRWITADMAYRRDVLAAVGGFDERFPHAYREDTELAYRVRRTGWHLVRGTRAVTHPVRAEGRWMSLHNQRGNADDALLRRLYGPGWRHELGVPAGRRHRHAAVASAAGVTAITAALATGLRSTARDAAGPGCGWWRSALTVTALAAAGGWLAGTARFAWERIAPGPRDRNEVITMVATSVLIPPLAVGHWLRGWWCSRRQTSMPVVGPVVGSTAGPVVRSTAGSSTGSPPQPSPPAAPATRPPPAAEHPKGKTRPGGTTHPTETAHPARTAHPAVTARATTAEWPSAGRLTKGRP